MTKPVRGIEPVVSCLADDPDLGELVAIYAQEMPERVEMLQDRFAAGDWPALARCAHQLKGAAGSHGFHQLTEPAGALEYAAREQPDPRRIEAALEALVDLCRRVQ
jgi:HPt (histidine-containing phosphotransfer) domain-containing protein